MRPKVYITCSTRRPTGPAWLTSPVQVSARRPAARIWSAVLSTSRQPAFFSSSGNVAGSRPVPVTTTSAPSRASSIAVARPIPRRRPAPVTTATLPSNAPMIVSFREERARRRSGRHPEDRVIRRDARELLLRRVRADATEESVDLPRPPLEVGAQDRRLLAVGHFLDAHGLGPATDGEPPGPARPDVADPLRLPARGDQVAPARELERVDRGPVPRSALAPLHRQDLRSLQPETQAAGEEIDDRIEDLRGEESGPDV